MTTTFPTRNCEHLKAGDYVAVIRFTYEPFMGQIDRVTKDSIYIGNKAFSREDGYMRGREIGGFDTYRISDDPAEMASARVVDARARAMSALNMVKREGIDEKGWQAISSAIIAAYGESEKRKAS